MLFVIHMLDRADASELRVQTAATHRTFVGEHLDKMYLGGPLLDERGEEAVGSLIVMDFPDGEATERFIAQEPYNVDGLFERVTIPYFSPLCFSPVVEPGKQISSSS